MRLTLDLLGHHLELSIDHPYDAEEDEADDDPTETVAYSTTERAATYDEPVGFARPRQETT